MTSEPNLTDAKRRGLKALLHVHPKSGRESNVTMIPLGYVYWQTARWLLEQGYAYYPSGSTMLNFTEAGLKRARSLA